MWVSNNDVWELAGETRIPKNDPEYPKMRKLAPCTWTLIEKVVDSGRELGEAMNPFVRPANVRAGQPATHSGYWFTVAQENSRQYFEQVKSYLRLKIKIGVKCIGSLMADTKFKSYRKKQCVMS